MKDPNALRQQMFNNQRAQANQAIKAQHQDQEGAINRRMAAIGQQGGAAIGAQLKLNEQTANQRAAVDREIGNQEMQANIASGEAELGRQFQAKEAQLGRDFAGREAQVGRDFAAREAQVGRDFAGSQAQKDMDFKRGLFDIENANKQREIDLAYQQFELDKDTTAFNRRMAEIEANRPDPGLLGSGGFLGTGIGGPKGFLGSGIGTNTGGTIGLLTGGVFGGMVGNAVGDVFKF